MIYFYKALEIDELTFERKMIFFNLTKLESSFALEMSDSLGSITTHMANLCSSFNAQIEMLRKSSECRAHWGRAALLKSTFDARKRGKISWNFCIARFLLWNVMKTRKMSKVESYKNRIRDLLSVISDRGKSETGGSEMSFKFCF